MIERTRGATRAISIFFVTLMGCAAFSMMPGASAHSRTVLTSITGEAWDVNVNGQVVGIDYTPLSTAFLLNPIDTNADGIPDSWYQDNGAGGNSLLQSLGTMSPGRWSEADAINVAGQIAGGGEYEVSPGIFRDCIYLLTPDDIDTDGTLEWFQDGGSGVNLLMHYIPGPVGSTATWCWNMNHVGSPIIVGEYRTVGGQWKACVWSEASGWVILGTLGGVSSVAQAVNDNGVIVGWAQNAGGQQHAFAIQPEWNGVSYVWWKDVGGDGINDLMTDLGSLGGTACRAQAVNNAAIIVGYGLDSLGKCHPLKWAKSGGIWQMEDLSAAVPSFFNGAAYAINDDGVIVGMRNTSWNGDERIGVPVRLSGTRLHDLDRTATGIAWSISNAGIVAGVMNSRPIVWTTDSPPVAEFTSSASDLSVFFDASASYDPDGRIVSYLWDFGDSSVGATKTPSHVYASEGTYSVTLTVCDDFDQTGTKTALVSVTAPSSSALSYTRIDLTGVGEAWDVNARGQVVGAVSNFNQAFLVNPIDNNMDGSPDLWFVDNGATGNSLMLTLGSMIPNGWSEADAINSVGQIAGCGRSPISSDTVYLITPEDIDGDGGLEWFEDGGSGVNLLMRPIPGPTGTASTWSWSMNEYGSPMIVGCYFPQSAPTERKACVWSEATGWVTLGTLGGADSVATAINDNGVIVGWAKNSAGQQHAFVIEPETNGASYVWWKDSGGDGINDLMFDLGSISSGLCRAQSVNNVPTVVGYGLDSLGHCRALQWEKVEGIWQMTDMSAIIPSWLGGAAYAINDNGNMVGMRNTFVSADERYGVPVRVDETTLRDLDTLPGGIAWSISAKRIVVGGMNNEPVVWIPHASWANVTTWLTASTIDLGGQVTDTVLVSDGTGLGPTPTGTIDFEVKTWGMDWMKYDTETLVDGQATSIPFMPLITGLYWFRAVYSGDSNHPSASSGNDSEPLEVGPAVPTVTTQLEWSSITLGESVRDTVVVIGLPEPFPVPTGTVTFQVSYDGGWTWNSFSTKMLDMNGIAVSDPFLPLSAGTYFFRAIYLGDSNYQAVRSDNFDEAMSVGCAPTVMTIQLSSSSITLGQSVTCTATLMGLEGGSFPKPGGTVQFYVKVGNGNWMYLGSPVHVMNGQAVSDAYTPGFGESYHFKASSSGDTNFLSAQTGDYDAPLAITPATPTVNTQISSSTVALGGLVTDMVTVTGLGGYFPLPTGTVQFQVRVGEEPWIDLGSPVLLVDGHAISDPYLPQTTGDSSCHFRALYSGDVNYGTTQSGDVADPLSVTGFVLSLQPAWNFVTVPPGGYGYMASTLGLANSDVVCAWNAAKQSYDKTYIIGVTPSWLDFPIEPSTGYWIYVVGGPEVLTLNGTIPTSVQERAVTVPVSGSWVTIGFNSLDSNRHASNIPAMYSGATVTEVVSFDPVKKSYLVWLSVLPGINDFVLTPGQACWIFVTGSGTLTYDP